MNPPTTVAILLVAIVLLILLFAGGAFGIWKVVLFMLSDRWSLQLGSTLVIVGVLLEICLFIILTRLLRRIGGDASPVA